MKEDVGPAPPKPPRKRRQLEQAADLHLAIWLADDSLTPSEHRRVKEEKERRKHNGPPVIVTRLATREGMTRPQRAAFTASQGEPDEVRYWDSGDSGQYQPQIKGATLVLAAPKEMSKPVRPPAGSIWEAIRYAHHRGVPVKVFMPNGEELKGESS